jgi:hypothetical protein
MEAEQRGDTVWVCMRTEDAHSLLRELDKWPDLPEVEQHLVDALKKLLHDGHS